MRSDARVAELMLDVPSMPAWKWRCADNAFAAQGRRKDRVESSLDPRQTHLVRPKVMPFVAGSKAGHEGDCS
jgi:hypothetical protein